MPYLILGILYTAVYLGAGALLGGHPLARTVVANTLLFLLAASICVVVLRRRREWEGTHRLFWDAFAAGMAMWCVGEIGFTVSTVTDHRTWVQWHTMFSLCGGIGPLVALLALPHLGTRKSAAWAVGVDLISYAMLMGFVYAYFIMVPSVVPAVGPSPQATLLCAGPGPALPPARRPRPERLEGVEHALAQYVRPARARRGRRLFPAPRDERRHQHRPVPRGQLLRPRVDRAVSLLPVGRRRSARLVRRGRIRAGAAADGRPSRSRRPPCS